MEVSSEIQALVLYLLEHDKKPVNLPQCEICKEFFVDRTQYKNHVNNEHSEKEINECIFEKNSYKPKKNLDNYCEDITDIDNLFATANLPIITSKSVCNICNKTFPNAANLKIHYESIHETKTYECKTCKKDFKRKSTLLTHVKSFHGKIKARHQCSQCKESYISPFGLKTHFEIVHENKRHSCNTCGKRFTRISSLQDHILAMHGKSKLYKCDMCEKRFSRKKTLKEHKNIVHSYKEKQNNSKTLFECDICEEKFKCKGDNRHHIKSPPKFD